MFKMVRKLPFLSYAAYCNIAIVGILLLGSVGAGYDDGSVGSIANLLLLIWCGIAFPFFGPIEALQFMPQPWGMILGWLIGLSICIVAELLFQRFWRRRVA